MSITFKPYFIECITNLHVGSGDANYGIVDKLVQRDTLTGYPTIHSSSLKGALREHFEQKWKDDATKVNDIFGKEGKGGSDSETGDYKFLSADLIAIPARSNFKSYVLGIQKTLIEEANRKAKLFTGKAIFSTIGEGNALYLKGRVPNYDVFAEDISLDEKVAHANPLAVSGFTEFEERYATFKDSDFTNLCQNLPVIARNKLGENKNLWYEEVVPHKTVFITYIGVTDKHLTDFEAVLKSDLIQIGANASVGYGLCKFYAITPNS